MAVGEGGENGIAAYWLDLRDLDELLSRLQHLLARAVATHFGRRRIDPQELAWQLENLAIIECDFQHSRLLMQFDFGRLWRAGSHGGIPGTFRQTLLYQCLLLCRRDK